jgi:Recombinase zinc beta ribbon domain
LVLCGQCGRTMTVRYHQRGDRLSPEYVCQKECVEQSKPVCQRIPGAGIDQAVGEVLVDSVSPLALEVVLNVQAEIQARLEEAERLRQQQVQRAQYEADQARVRYMRVDPNHRLVADTLEAQWNEKLRALAQAKEECEKQRQLDATQISAEQKAKILALAADFPELWRDPKTSDRDRKRMARLLLEDVTLRRERQDIGVQLRFKGGATRELRLPFPKSAWELRKTKPEIVTAIDRLLADHTEGEIAPLLNELGWRSSGGAAFTVGIVNRLRCVYQLKSRAERLRAIGLLTAYEIAQIIGGVASRVKYWRQCGVLSGVRYSEKSEYLYHNPTPAMIQEIRRRRGLYGRKLPLNSHCAESSP